MPAAARRVSRGRREIVDILNAADDRLLVIVGPCSIHDPVAAVEYARRLAQVSQQLEPDLCIVMRAYCEKPRTTVGWKGLLHDPRLDGSCAVEDGLVVTRELLLDLLDVGVPIACEFLDPMAAAFTEDVVSWGSIGARTSESPIHRQLASHLSMPIGFKNAMHGSVKVAVDAIFAAGHPHRFIRLNDEGYASVVTSRGNTDCHLVLRGGPWPNHDALAVAAATDALHAAGLPARVLIDASHGNSGKDHRRQARVVRDVAEQVGSGADSIRGDHAGKLPGGGSTATSGIVSAEFRSEHY